jgi:hypothetical protein
MTDLTEPLMQPDLEAGEVKLEEEVQPQKEVKPEQPQPKYEDLWYGNLFGLISLDGLLWMNWLTRMTSRLGHERSLLDCCYLRFRLLPAVRATPVHGDGLREHFLYEPH